MRKFPLVAILVLCLGFLAASCRQETSPGAAEVVKTVSVIVEVTRTPEPATHLPEPSATATDLATPAMNPVQATLEAMKSAARSNQENGTPRPTRAPVAVDDYPAIFEQAWRLIDENYVRDDFNGVDWQAVHDEYLPQVEQARDQEAFWDLMEAFVGELRDDHSRFVRPDQFAAEFDMPEIGDGGQPWPGFTVWPAREDEYLTLWDVCERGPAASAGLERGDIILEINGEPVERGEEGFDTGDISALLYAGEDEVRLTVQQGEESEPREVVVPFGGAAGCDGWYYGVLSEDPYIGYIRIADFAGDADSNILQVIEELEADQPLDGLVLDVRHNPGGNSDRSVAIFTEGNFGKVGSLREGATQTIYQIRGPVRWNTKTPVRVLIDGNSHSAAEYFATAMQQSGRAELIGMPTAGNTEGITGFSLPDGSLIRLAVMTLILPDGTTLEGSGVQPDERVPLGEWGLRQRPDAQLEAAYRSLLEEIQ